MRPAVAVLVSALILLGCSDDEDEVPVSCRQGQEAVHAALKDAPRPVTIDGTRLSDCIEDSSSGGALQEVGEAYLEVAADLADDAVRDPNGAAAVRLGYLLGAFERDREGAQGIGYELGRRLRTEVARVDTRSPAFRRGLRAGRRYG